MVFQTGGQGFPLRRSHLSWPSMREVASPGGAKGERVPGQGTAETKAGDLGACFCSSRLGVLQGQRQLRRDLPQIHGAHFRFQRAVPCLLPS